MTNFIYCLNTTMPIFLLMVLGYILRRTGMISEPFAKSMNAFVFKVSLPVLVFKDLSQTAFREMWDGGFLAFCFAATILSIMIAGAISLFWKEDRAEFIQSSYRSSAALLGIGIVENLYGSSGMVPLMIIGAVPLYNVAAVLLLELLKPGMTNNRKSNSKAIKAAFYDIAKNPIIIGIVIGVIWSLLKIPQPLIFQRVVGYVSNTATPLGLIALGASLNVSQVKGRLGHSVVAVFLKLVGFCAIFLPVAIVFGYTKDRLIAILIMLGSPTTVSSFVMAKSMGHDGTLSGSTVFITTFFSAVTLTLWLFVLKLGNMI